MTDEELRRTAEEADRARWLAEARVWELEREVDRLRRALRGVVEAFTMEPDPDRA